VKGSLPILKRYIFDPADWHVARHALGEVSGDWHPRP
jgi:hypothetical protein